jgi:hypothetical protein
LRSYNINTLFALSTPSSHFPHFSLYTHSSHSCASELLVYAAFHNSGALFRDLITCNYSKELLDVHIRTELFTQDFSKEDMSTEGRRSVERVLFRKMVVQQRSDGQWWKALYIGRDWCRGGGATQPIDAPFRIRNNLHLKHTATPAVDTKFICEKSDVQRRIMRTYVGSQELALGFAKPGCMVQALTYSNLPFNVDSNPYSPAMIAEVDYERGSYRVYRAVDIQLFEHKWEDVKVRSLTWMDRLYWALATGRFAIAEVICDDCCQLSMIAALAAARICNQLAEADQLTSLSSVRAVVVSTVKSWADFLTAENEEGGDFGKEVLLENAKAFDIRATEILDCISDSNDAVKVLQSGFNDAVTMQQTKDINSADINELRSLPL